MAGVAVTTVCIYALAKVGVAALAVSPVLPNNPHHATEIGETTKGR